MVVVVRGCYRWSRLAASPGVEGKDWEPAMGRQSRDEQKVGNVGIPAVKREGYFHRQMMRDGQRLIWKDEAERVLVAMNMYNSVIYPMPRKSPTVITKIICTDYG